MANIAARFRALLPDASQQVVDVVAVNANGTSVVENAAGDQWTVIGDTVTAGNKALVQGGRIISAAADLPTYNVNV